MVQVVTLLGLLILTLAFICITGCVGPVPPAAASTRVPAVVTALAARATDVHPAATFDPNSTPRPVAMLSAPTASAGERQNASNTWLHLTAFQSGNVSVLDPLSGHVLREFPVVGDQAGMAVSPDGTRLYIVDGNGFGYDNDELRVYDTNGWQASIVKGSATVRCYWAGTPSRCPATGAGWSSHN